jgi:hypothetical protein
MHEITPTGAAEWADNYNQIIGDTYKLIRSACSQGRYSVKTRYTKELMEHLEKDGFAVKRFKNLNEYRLDVSWEHASKQKQNDA